MVVACQNFKHRVPTCMRHLKQMTWQTNLVIPIHNSSWSFTYNTWTVHSGSHTMSSCMQRLVHQTVGPAQHRLQWVLTYALLSLTKDSIAGNQTHQLVLDLSRSLFGSEGECQFAEYMPVMSTICALVWITLFTMCPGGGRPRTG